MKTNKSNGSIIKSNSNNLKGNAAMKNQTQIAGSLESLTKQNSKLVAQMKEARTFIQQMRKVAKGKTGITTAQKNKVVKTREALQLIRSHRKELAASIKGQRQALRQERIDARKEAKEAKLAIKQQKMNEKQQKAALLKAKKQWAAVKQVTFTKGQLTKAVQSINLPLKPGDMKKALRWAAKLAKLPTRRLPVKAHTLHIQLLATVAVMNAVKEIKHWK